MLQSEIRRVPNVGDVQRQHDDVKHLIETWDSHPHPIHTAVGLFQDAMRLSAADEDPLEAIAVRLRGLASPHLSAGTMYSLLADLALYTELITEELGYPFPLISDANALFDNVLLSDDDDLRDYITQAYDTLAPMLHHCNGFYPGAAWFNSLHAAVRIISAAVALSYDVEPWCAILISSERWYSDSLPVEPLSPTWDTVLKLEFRRKEVRS